MENKFNNACLNGDIEIVKTMTEKLDTIDLFHGFCDACRGGHIEIIELLISDDVNDWNKGLGFACLYDRVAVVHFFIEKGANDWNNGLNNACRGDHVDIINLMIEKGANDWYMALFFSIMYGRNYDIHMLMIKKGAYYNGHHKSLNKFIIKKFTEKHIIRCILNNLLNNDVSSMIMKFLR